MARICDLSRYNTLRVNDTFSPFEEKKISFENHQGETMLITPIELKEELNKFIDLQFASMTSEDLERKKEYIKPSVVNRNKILKAIYIQKKRIS
jgi:hypothetical protein